MKDWKLQHKIFAAAGALAAAALIYAGVAADRMLRIASGYKAKIACSEIFVAGRDAREVIDKEFAGMDPAMEQVSVSVKRGAALVRAGGPFGLGAVRAVYRPGYGCTIASGGRVAALPDAPAGVAPAPWEEAPDGSIPRVDDAALDAALTRAFAGNDAGHRAVLVAVDGRIVDERYADGFSADTPFLSWSMAKSVTATLFGAAAMRGLVDADSPAPVPEWDGDAAKSAITWNDLLQMQSGLAFGERYDEVRSDANRMLFEKADAGGFAVRMPVEPEPGEVWSYSSGTSNILARTLAQVLSGEGTDIYSFARSALLAPLGAASVVLEPDASGNVVGSSFMYATARDWARLGQLYLQDGVWNGERLLPEGWTDYVSTPAAASDNQYGAHLWLNRDGANGRERFFPGVSEETYFFAGHEGQYVFIVPGKNMVIVRTGMTRGRNAMQAVGPLIAGIYAAVGETPEAGNAR